MLRDIAYVLNGTGSQFEVAWDESAGAISLLPGVVYTPVGGEMQPAADANETATASTAAVLVDGAAVKRAYNIGGNNFFILRDLGDALGFEVDWDAAAGAVVIATEPAGAYVAVVTLPANVESEEVEEPVEEEGHGEGPAAADEPVYVTIAGEQFSTSHTSLEIEALNLTNEDIANLVYMVNLTELTIISGSHRGLFGMLGTSDITDISPLAGLTNLIRLHIEGIQGNNLSPLAYLTNLNALVINRSEISDLSPLSGLTSLSSLHLYSNSITDWSPVDHVDNVLGRP